MGTSRASYMDYWPSIFLGQWENLTLSWPSSLVPLKKVELFIPWWLEKRSYRDQWDL